MVAVSLTLTIGRSENASLIYFTSYQDGSFAIVRLPCGYLVLLCGHHERRVHRYDEREATMMIIYRNQHD